MPSVNNPFMNVLLTDITDNPKRADAAPVSNPSVRGAIDTAFQSTSDIYMDTSDRFDQKAAQRTFHTIQSSRVPNDQDAFLSWLAKGYDEPDTSSTALARGAKLGSEGFVPARGSMSGLPNTTKTPSGTTPKFASE
jgi:cation transport regulator ChaB